MNPTPNDSVQKAELCVWTYPLCRPLAAGSLSEQLDVVFASLGASSDPGLR